MTTSSGWISSARAHRGRRSAPDAGSRRNGSPRRQSQLSDRWAIPDGAAALGPLLRLKFNGRPKLRSRTPRHRRLPPDACGSTTATILERVFAAYPARLRRGRRRPSPSAPSRDRRQLRSEAVLEGVTSSARIPRGVITSGVGVARQPATRTIRLGRQNDISSHAREPWNHRSTRAAG